MAIVGPSGHDELPGSDPPRKRFALRARSRRWVFLSTVVFLVANAVVIVSLSTLGSASGKSCGGFSGYSGGGGDCVSDLSVSNIDVPDPARVGGYLMYLIEVENKGPDEAFLVELTDVLPGTLPIEWIMTPGSPYGYCSSQGRSVFCTFYDVAVHEKAAITLVTRPILPGTVKNTAIASSSSQDPNPANNTRVQKTQVNG